MTDPRDATQIDPDAPDESGEESRNGMEDEAEEPAGSEPDTPPVPSPS
jgi:hypothetical protein